MSQATAPPSLPASGSADTDKRVVLVSYPKIVFLYPTLIVALIAAIYMHFSTGSVDALSDASRGEVIVGWSFLITLSLNLVVMSFDFPRTTSLTLFFVIVALALGGVLLFIYFPNLLPSLTDFLLSIEPRANAMFYYIFTAVLLILFGGVMLNRRFDYWEVRPNELLHHHGFLSDLKRYASPGLRIDKEINDVFEYMLLGSGRLILHAAEENRAIVLDNVLWISRKEQQITKLLGALQVQVRNPNEAL